MATLTGQRIKDTYDAVLKLEDNAALTSSPKAITDGLGNNTPISVSTIKVDVSSDLEAASFVKTSGLSTQFLKADGSVDSSAYLTSGDLPASHWSSNLVGIDYAGGNVGIGTTTPSYPLEIAQTGYGLGVKNYITSTDVANSILAGYDPAAVYLGYGYGSKEVHIGSLNSGDVKIRTSGNTIIENGNVGIGTTSPSEKLHVSAGAIRLDNFYQLRWGGTGTGIYGHSTQGLNFYTDTGTTRLKIENGGNVGIGTTSPSERLEVNGNVDVNGGVYVSGVNSFVWNNTANSNLRFGANGSEKMRINSAGNVGIGTTAPTAKLQIDSTSGWGVFTERGIKDGSTSTYSHNYSAGNAHILGRAMYFENAAVFSTSTADSTTKEYRFSNASDKLTVKSLVAGNTFDNNILVLSGSNVGIGTASPLNKLQVSDGSVGIDSQYMIRDNRNNTILHQSANTAASNRSLTIGNATYSNVIIPNGNVGIGTTSPSEKLHVEGDIRLLDELIFGEYSTTTDKLTNQSYALTIAHSQAINFKVNTSSVFNVYGTQIRPQVNNTVDLGHSGFRWKKGYFAGNLIASSIGIGTDYPSDELTIEAENPTIRLKDISSSNYAELYVNNFDTYLNSNGRVFLQSGGSTRATVTPAGNVGIGTTSPSEKLEVTGPIGSTKLTGYKLIFTRNANNEIFTEGASSTLTLGTNSVERMRINSAGNVGIGTNSPNEKLEIYGGNLIVNDGTSKSRLRPNDLYLQSSGTINAWIRANGVSYFNGGNVGIGTTNPSSKLHVTGATVIDGFTTGSAMALNVGGSNNAQIRTRHVEGKSYNSSSLGELNLNYYSSHNVSMAVGGGNVGIGTTSPSQKLEVDGQVLSDGYRLAAMQTAPATRNSTGTLGEIVIDGNYIYVCYAANSWSRVALETSW